MLYIYVSVSFFSPFSDLKIVPTVCLCAYGSSLINSNCCFPQKEVVKQRDKSFDMSQKLVLLKETVNMVINWKWKYAGQDINNLFDPQKTCFLYLNIPPGSTESPTLRIVTSSWNSPASSPQWKWMVGRWCTLYLFWGAKTTYFFMGYVTVRFLGSMILQPDLYQNASFWIDLMATPPCAMRHAEVLTPYLDRSLLETIYRSVGQSLGKKPGFWSGLVGRNGAKFVRETRVYIICFEGGWYGKFGWFNVSTYVSTSLWNWGKCLGSMCFSWFFLLDSKPLTNIPLRESAKSWNRFFSPWPKYILFIYVLFMYLFIVDLFIYWFIYLFIDWFIYLLIHLFIDWSIYLFIFYLFYFYIYIYLYIQYISIYIPRTQTTLVLIGVLGLVLGLLTKNRGLIRYIKKLMKQWWTSGVVTFYQGNSGK